jgi:peptide-methionine (R)-S-oxide reductase
MKYTTILTGLLLVLLFMACSAAGGKTEKQTAQPEQLKVFSVAEGGYIMVERMMKTAKEWKNILTPEQYRILREKGTEPAFSGEYWDNHEQGIYRCAGCGQDLFSSEDKYDSGTGWPSYSRPVAPENIVNKPDFSLFMKRTEVLCSRCGGHLGHVFEDGPQPSGLRYCINSASLYFLAAE